MGQAFGHGKVILFGEHAVVHGYPALAAALELGCSASAGADDRSATHDGGLLVQPWGVSLQAHEDPPDRRSEALQRAFRELLRGYDPEPRLTVHAQMQLPSSAGLGGSAALSVAIVRALDAALGLSRSNAEVAALAQSAERVFHGNPSGIDAAMAAHGGVAQFRRSRGIEAVRLARSLPLVIGHSGEPGSTKHTVASVERQLQNDPGKVTQIFDGIEAIVHNARLALESGALADLGQLMVLNHKLLSSLLLSTTRLEAMCNAAIDAGALGAKLTGGGGGGCMIALCRDDASAQHVAEALRALGREAFTTEVRP